MREALKKFYPVFPVTVLAGLFLSLPDLVGQEMIGRSEMPDASTRKLSQEVERDKELLAIWKDHVRTLTKERDEAYKQLETLKSQAPEEPGAAPALAVNTEEIQSLARERDEAYRTIESLKAQIESFKSKNQGGTIRIERELREVQADKDVILRDKENALSEIEKLKSEIQTLREAAVSVPNRGTQDSGPAGGSRDIKLRLVQKEFEEARAAFASEIIELQSANKKLSADKEASDATREALGNELKAEREKTASVSEENNRSVSDVQKELEDARNNQRAMSQEMRSLKALERKLETENQRLRVFEKEFQKSGSDREYLGKAYQDLESESKLKDQKIQDISSELYELRDAQSRLVADKEEVSKEKETALNQIEELKAEIQGKLAEIHGLETVQGQKEAAESETESVRKEKGDALRQVQSLQVQLDKLQTTNEGMKSTEEELLKTRADKESIEQAYRELENKLKAQGEKLDSVDREQDMKLREILGQKEESDREVGALRSELAALQEENEKFRGLQDRVQKAEADNEAVVNEKRDAEKEIEGLKVRIQSLRAQSEKTKFIESELEDARAAFSSELGELQEKNKRLSAEKRLIEKNYEELVNNTKLKDEKLSNMVLKMDQMEKENTDIKSAESRRLETIQTMKKNLEANLSDIQNLKANFESYLESLVQSFDERAK